MKSTAKELAACAGSVASSAASKGAAAASVGAQKAADLAAKRATSGATALVGEERVAIVKEGASAAASTAKAAAGQVARTIEEEARAQALVLMSKGIERAMPRLASYAKKELVDPDMPGAVVRGLEAMIDTSMAEVHDLLAESLTAAVLKKAPDEKIDAPPPGCCSGDGGCCSPCSCLRAKILYTLFPHDRSMWSQFKNPLWWFLTLIGIFPLWGIRVAWWVFIFLLKDKSDDYQLCTFVITFKASLFLAGGVQSAFVGTALFQACTEASNCDSRAPGSNPVGFEFGLLGALVQSVCCWIVMGFLPWAKPKGGKLYEQTTRRLSKHVETANLAATKGGRLWYFMLYDAAIFVACVGGGAFAWYGTSEPDHIVRSRVFHIRMLYSTLAFPWLLLKLPLAWSLVLHLKPTGYNQAGHVVRMCNSKERRAAREKRLGLASSSSTSRRGESPARVEHHADIEQASP